MRIRLGMMKDYPSPYEDISYEVVECKEHVELSVEAARRSLVLLRIRTISCLLTEKC